ncbi:MAG: hypothetical protein LAT58_13720 [Opitutales bacterium]|nr:hypothetical protein [Opitutales bacterium]
MFHFSPHTPSRCLLGFFMVSVLVWSGCGETPEEEEPPVDEEAALSEDATTVDLLHTNIDPMELMEKVLALSEEEAEAQWAEFTERFDGREREHRRALINEFDSVGDGVVDPEQLDDFVEAEDALRRQQTQNLREYLLEQYDANGDGRLSRAELEEVFAAFRKIASLPSNSQREILARKSLELRLFDWENKGFLTPSEWVAAGRLRSEAFRAGEPDDTITIPVPVRPRRGR